MTSGKKKAQNWKIRKEKFYTLTGAFLKKFVSFLYIVGIQSVRILKRCRRRIKRALIPVCRFLKDRMADMKKGCRPIKEGLSLAKERAYAVWKKAVWPFLRKSFHSVYKGVVRHRDVFSGVFHVVAPVAAVFLLIFTVQYWSNQSFGLVLTVDGAEIATIEDERVFGEAAEMINGRLVTDALGSEGVGITPTYTLTMTDNTGYTSSSTLCDKLIESSGSVIEEASGLYVDGELVGVAESDEVLNSLLQEILDRARGGDPETEASFAQNVETVPGLYPVESIMSTEEMRALLSPDVGEKYYTVQKEDTAQKIAEAYSLDLSSLEKMNPGISVSELHEGERLQVASAKSFLIVRLIRNERYEEEIPYRTVTTKNDDEYTDYSETTVAGQNGIQECIDRVTYLDGDEISREEVSRTVVEEPIDKQVTVGTKKRLTPPGQSSGALMWPLPYSHNIFQHYSYYHSGVDVAASGIYGQTIVAADGGTVVSVKYQNYGYGYHVIIDHGNGMRTLYAHASKIYVAPGQKVSKGEPVAAVGSTGNSTGYHLHFEVLINGMAYNPLNYCR